jgi:hypothetical protein
MKRKSLKGKKKTGSNGTKNVSRMGMPPKKKKGRKMRKGRLTGGTKGGKTKTVK